MFKTYMRLLGFARPIKKYAVPYFFYSLFYALFNSLTFMLIIPILNTMFDANYSFEYVEKLPPLELNKEYLATLFNFTYSHIFQEYSTQNVLLLLAVVAVGYFTAGGIGNFCGIGFESITLLCPLGALLAMIAERTAIPMAVISVAVVLLVCIVLGKVFCAWACPVHFLSRGRKKGDKGDKEGKGGKVASPCSACASPCGKAKGIKIDSRHGILAAALGSTLVFGFSVFCLVCPIGLTFATVLLVMRLFAFGDATWTVVAFPVIIALEILLLPKWCQRFCPLGALLSLVSRLNRTFRPVSNEATCLRSSKGEHCHQCADVCPEGIDLHDASASAPMNECTKCRACADACPMHAISFPFLPKRVSKDGDGVEAGEDERVLE